MTPLLVDDCWNRIGVRGNRSCPELATVVHCQNCPVFAAAGRTFLDADVPAGYRDEWTERLAAVPDDDCGEHESVLAFRIADEWLAMNVQSLVEVTAWKAIHRVPHRAGILAGLVNVRGELHLCMDLAKVLGIAPAAADLSSRMLLVRRGGEGWALPVDAVDRVRRVQTSEIQRPPATITRALAHLVRGVVHRDSRAIGLLDEARLFDTLRSRLR